MTERWKPIPGFEGYEVSDHGRVRSYWKRKSLGIGLGSQSVLCKEPQCILAANGRQSARKGQRGRYPVVGINSRAHAVHRLVMLAFVGPCPDGLIVCHNDDNPENNRLSNLRYDTQASNLADAQRRGAMPRGYNSVLSEEQIIEMRKLAASGATRAELARKFGVCHHTATNICTGKTCRDIEGPIIEAMPQSPPRSLDASETEAIKNQLQNSSLSASFIAIQYNTSPTTISRIKAQMKHDKEIFNG